jgi:hypothetical protein
MPVKPEKQQAWNEFISGFEGKLPPERMALLRQAFDNLDGNSAEAAIHHGADGVMMRSEFSRLGLAARKELEDAKALQQDLQVKAQQVADYDLQLKAWEDYLKQNTVSREEYLAIENKMNLLEQYRASVEGQLKTLDLEGLVEDPLRDQPRQNGDNMPDNNNVPRHSQNQNSSQSNQNGQRPAGQFVSKLELNDAVLHGTVGSVLGTAQLFELSNRYTQLTGKPLENIDKLVEEALTLGKPIKEFIEQKLEFSKLASEKETAAREAEIKSRVDEELARRLSELKLPSASARTSNTNVLAQVMGEDPTQKGKPVQPGRFGEGSRRAAEAYYQGKYRDGRGGGILG